MSDCSNKNNVNNISDVVKNNLCCSCGACCGICENEAIEMIGTSDGRIVPFVKENCIHCGKCNEICPGKAIKGFEEYISKIENPFEGNCIVSYTGKATDPSIYSESQSGGLVTAILDHLLKNGDIQGAIVTKNKINSCDTNEMVIVKTKEELIQSQKSKYTQSTALKCLNDLKKFDGKIALVGLPCHIHALQNLKETDRLLSSKIKYSFGLICDRLQTNMVIELFALKVGLKLPDIKTIIFRDKKSNRGYPGDLKIIDKLGKTIILPSEFRMSVKDYFTPMRCRYCFDKMNVFSDVVFGDPHGIIDCDRTYGESICIARNQLGEKLLKNVIKNEAIKVKKIMYDDILKGQNIQARYEQWKFFTENLIKNNKSLPEQNKLLWNNFKTDPLSKNNQLFVKQLVLNEKMQKNENNNELLNGILLEQDKISIDSHYLSKKPKIIEIIGTNFVNKGAMLMLLACIDKIRKRFGRNVKIAMPPCEMVRKFLLYDIIPSLSGLIVPEDIDLVLDASGFTYSDKFYPGVTANRAKQYRKYKECGAKIVLMPQAFGPFEIPMHRNDFNNLTISCDLIFARESKSFNFISDAISVKRPVSIVPDFTNLLDGILPENAKNIIDRTAIIPNIRMIQFARSQDEVNQYIQFISNSFSIAEKYGQNPFFLIHEGTLDLILANRINNYLGNKYEIVIEEDPVNLKGIIGKCSMIISSRFHGIVSALSQAVPTLAVGWSHKYEELFKDYDFMDGFLPLNISREDLECKFQIILKDNQKKIKNKLICNADNQKKSIEKMWGKIFSIIDC